ncbi:ATP-dependent metallopeptidase FtsH/Yme1/Tma family protein [Corallococcus exiguus]|uniref:ATP-dependent zinc metalloprotease FtsH n=1 Tax=Corallococcus exiguus TaxID=83462 RepID=A0A7Y1RM58_9BACT|nr:MULTISPECIES: ATP-dependent zinc metalloprotease FtsH [Corallococcus]NBC44531.1 ATP-dependent zinc metalloprotease FtsH [Corallococcus exiguus]NNB86960.1 ATP-dependent metallopeptidase FtsH/Yme1/Tma family protein [Corallococcus exiguus]NNB93555.1 ATP-dependent metallopeptidase FtsH/Yme1/Tma family protein [Corallococcus exiguus]NNC01613.1 ATP-dependent metallopeptidase FtsH/Yme1/Tma family protein [Corallococcus exiguus]NNC16827.1 ATP-dependent metallopeptidase FtsH/Yme1/Tma family protein
MRSTYKTIGLWVILIVLFVAFYNFFSQGNEQVQEPTFTQLLTKVEEKKVRAVSVKGNTYSGTFSDSNDKFRTTGPPPDVAVLNQLRASGVDVKYEREEQNSLWLTILGQWMPVVFLFLFFIFFMRQLQGGSGKAMTFGKSKAKLLSESHNKVTFADVAGVDECKEELEEIVAFLKDPKKFTKLGGRIPKGVLMMGPPGTGKTLLARAVAGEAGVPFFSISGSDFVEMFVGVGASRVRDLFEQGKKNAPCIIFIDEIDAVGRHRGAGLGGGHDEREQTLNQLLVEMDGFESNDGVILIAATNRPDVLDPALQRPGRFDRRIIVPRPDLKGRLGVLKVHTRRVPLAPEVELEVIARGTPGMTGADLENLVNESALMAARQNKERVDLADFEQAKDKVFMGPERRSMIMTDKEKRNTAVHEAGHALLAKLLPGCDPLHKVTIIPRGQALGVTWSLPTEDKVNGYRKQILDQITMAMGGRIAEELMFNEMSSGAANDIERATETARAMVCRWGMSEKMGPLAFGKSDGEVFLGRDFNSSKDYSEDTARQIDMEVRSIVVGCYTTGKQLLTDKLDVLQRVSDALVEYETLDAEDVNIILQGGQLTRERPAPRVSSSPKPTEKKDKRKILDALEGLPNMEPKKA